MKIPSLHFAEQMLAEAEQLNPGPWADHSRNVALAGRLIAEQVAHLDPEAAYILGLLHDIGRREGVTGMRHVIDGYRFLLADGYEDAARIALTHSFPIPDAYAGSSKWDATPEEIAEVQQFLKSHTYDDYDHLFQLCDSIALPDRFCLVETRWVDVLMRYQNFNEFTIPKWRAIDEVKAHFDQLVGHSIYHLLPGMLDTILG